MHINISLHARTFWHKSLNTVSVIKTVNGPPINGTDVPNPLQQILKVGIVERTSRSQNDLEALHVTVNDIRHPVALASDTGYWQSAHVSSEL